MHSHTPAQTHAHAHPHKHHHAHTKQANVDKPNIVPVASDELSPEITFFWDSTGPHGFLSQQFPASFTAPSTATDADDTPLAYASAEQYMMHRKALLFAGSSSDSDSDPDADLVIRAILATGDPSELKALGRQIRGFDETTWLRHRDAIVEEGNYLKFSQNAGLRAALLATRGSEIVEAAPDDRVWGIGFVEADADPAERQGWGLNLLGRALERVRARLIAEDKLSSLAAPA